MADNPFAHQFDNLQPFTKEEVERNLQVIDEILHPPVTLEQFRQEFRQAHLAINRIEKTIIDMQAKLAPLIALATAIPEAMESNPMMKMLLGRMSK
jgi:hypothetical protein